MADLTEEGNIGVVQKESEDPDHKGEKIAGFEFVAIVYRAIRAGAASNPALNQDGTLDKLANEFSSEMKYIRIDTIAKDKNGKPTIERVRVIPDTQHDAQS